MGWRTDVLAWNRAATLVFGDFGALPAGERSWLRLLFTDTPVRRRFVNWELAVRDFLAIYRAASARHLNDPGPRITSNAGRIVCAVVCSAPDTIPSARSSCTISVPK